MRRGGEVQQPADVGGEGEVAGVEVVHQPLHGVRLHALQVDGDGAHAGAAPLAGEQGGEVGGARHEDALVTRHRARLEHKVELKMKTFKNMMH